MYRYQILRKTFHFFLESDTAGQTFSWNLILLITLCFPLCITLYTAGMSMKQRVCLSLDQETIDGLLILADGDDGQRSRIIRKLVANELKATGKEADESDED